MRIVVVGAVESTVAAIEALLESQTAPAAVVTLPREALSRHSDAIDISQAVSATLPIIYAEDVNSAPIVAEVRQLNPDIIFIVGWSQVCKAPFRKAARLGCIGFHPSLLPKLRGRAVIPWTILTHQQETGASFFWIDDGIDTGDILRQQRFRLRNDETARSLYDRQRSAIRELIPQIVNDFHQGVATRTPQNHDNATYCARRRPRDGKIDWHADADGVLTFIRAVGDPYPGAFTTMDGERLSIWTARPYADSHRYIGLPGQIQTLTTGGFVVRCGNGECVEVTKWTTPADRKIARHAVLGEAE
ncbi:methionyl-tRNA formyltransferase [Rhizobium sullae]|uniref:Methionyl-tRNA formyltransferase n=1 Tax=Rhizobium sullae TaxID=50338 RepID=A0A4R3Q2I7_RHISU|nr:methionyl-tRNA formyltransferase [Rhizobium sullae]TCU15181.1 methionyl-tRNA formyltransferase [Rhizobium sullae]